MTKKLPLWLQAAVLLSGLFLIAGLVHADNQSRMYGKDAPFKVEDLPPNSRLGLDLEKLSPR